MFQTKKIIASIVGAVLLSGCGAGGADSDLTSGSSRATFVSGVYTTIYSCNSMTTGTLIDDKDNMYQVCGTKLSIGKLSGTLNGSSVATGSVQFTVFDAGTPASSTTIELPNGSYTVPIAAGKPTVTTSPVFSGTLFINNNKVTEISFTDTPGQAGNASFSSKWVGASPAGSIAASYSTLAGNYVLYRPEKLGVDASENISISSSGVISGTTNLGTISGQITKFNSSGVHDVSVTLTPQSGAALTMVGVLGPYDVNMTGSTLKANYAGILLAVSGNGTGFFRPFRHL